MKKLYSFLHHNANQSFRIAAFALVGLLLILFAPSANAQLPWNENFGSEVGGCSSQGTLASTFVSANGAWTVEDVTANGPFANNWYVSATASGGTSAGNCSSGCTSNPAVINRSLHIGTAAGGTVDVGATYIEFGGASNTDKRAVSPVIDLTGSFNVTLSFLYFTQNNASDYATVEYSIDGGATYSELGTLAPSPGGCAPAQTWTDYNTILPADANNQPNVRVAFRWRNNSDGVAASASVAIDKVRLEAGPPPQPPQPNFTVDVNSVCEGACLNFTDATIFDPSSQNVVYEWEFPGSETLTSSDQNPANICYQDPGTYDVTLTVSDNIGEAPPVTLFGFIEILDCGPVIDISASAVQVCAFEECVDFTDLSAGNNVNAWSWTFEGADTPSSTDQNPTGICYSVPGTYDVTLTATDDDGSETLVFPDYITVVDCAGPAISFEASRNAICVSECVQFTDLSTTESTITSWSWNFPGGNPATSTEQNPEVCYPTAGSYAVTLTATDAEGTQTVEQQNFIVVDPCTGPPTADFSVSDTNICAGDCIDFTDQTLGVIDQYLWTFQGTTNLVSTERDPSIICYLTPGVYDVTLVVSNQYGQDVITKPDFITVTDCLSPPMPRYTVSQDTVCAGQCVTFSDVSSGLGITSRNWSFPGAVQTSSTEQNPQVCYDNVGTYNAYLQVTGAGGVSDSLFTNVITVVATADCRPKMELSIPDTLCAGSCAYLSGNFQQTDSVHWLINGGDPQTSSAFTPGLVCFPDSGIYTIVVQAVNAAGTTSEVHTLYVGNPPLLNAGPDRTITSGATVTLSAQIGSGDGEFIWQPYDMVADFTSPVTTTQPMETTVYIAYYQEEGTCQAVDTVTINVNFVPAVGVPSAFSPNGDGNNDVLRVLGQGISRMEFKVYNRYGQVVFESTRQEHGWDGTYKGKELNPGVFVYTLEVIFAEGLRETYTGDVTLVK